MFQNKIPKMCFQTNENMTIECFHRRGQYVWAKVGEGTLPILDPQCRQEFLGALVPLWITFCHLFGLILTPLGSPLGSVLPPLARPKPSETLKNGNQGRSRTHRAVGPPLSDTQGRSRRDLASFWRYFLLQILRFRGSSGSPSSVPTLLGTCRILQRSAGHITS